MEVCDPPFPPPKGGDRGEKGEESGSETGTAACSLRAGSPRSAQQALAGAARPDGQAAGRGSALTLDGRTPPRPEYSATDASITRSVCADNITAVLTYHWKGLALAKLADGPSKVYAEITVANRCARSLNSINR